MGGGEGGEGGGRWKELCAVKGKWKEFGVGGMDEKERMMGMEPKRKAGRAGQGSKRE